MKCNRQSCNFTIHRDKNNNGGTHCCIACKTIAQHGPKCERIYFPDNLQEHLYNITKDKIGVEIGGPSVTGKTLYENSISIDNVIFSKDTVWSKHNNIYNYFPGKSGKVIINDAVDIHNIEDKKYDFIFASHALEHIANPLKALKEWVRIIKNSGYIILILPEKTHCFDHKREISKFETLLNQYEKNVGEDDLSTLPEILAKHDLARDPPAGNLAQFKVRSQNNFKNRCLHHYVYSPALLNQICDWAQLEFLYTITRGIDIWFIMKKIID